MVNNHFQLLNLPISFTVDLKQLDANYFELQKQFHPDKTPNFAVKSAEINEAYKTLKNKYKRLEYLVSLQGKPLEAPQTLLMEMMELREEFEENAPSATKKAEDEIQRLFLGADSLYISGKYDELAVILVKIKYLKKFLEDASYNT